MESIVQCCFCEEIANRFFLALDGNLWVSCDDHASPFRSTTLELDPEHYNLDDYFDDMDEEEGEYEGPLDS